MSLSAVADSSVGTAVSGAARSALSTDYQSFLKLLVAQAQNQDPLEPMDSTEFVSQLAQLTQVEQSVQLNAQMESLRSQLALSSALSETALIGREVTLPSDIISLTPEGANFAWRLAEAAEAVQIQIRDSEGVLVAVADHGPSAPGVLQEFTWDGIGADGNRLADGRYQITLALANAAGETGGSYQTYASAKVVAIDYADGLTRLQLADGRYVGSGEIVSAR